jgi:nucleoside phosphorylase
MILLCAATSIEARACRAGTSNAAQPIEVLKTGMGLKNAEDALRIRLQNGASQPRPSLIVSTGFAGSWSPRYRVGDWVVGKTVAYENRWAPLDLNPAREILPSQETLPRGDFRTLLEPAIGNAEVLVDMESFSWAKVAHEFQIPFLILRMISDSPSHPLPKTIQHLATGSFGRGMMSLPSEPRALMKFVARGARLPGLLKQGWISFSSTF